MGVLFGVFVWFDFVMVFVGTAMANLVPLSFVGSNVMVTFMVSVRLLTAQKQFTNLLIGRTTQTNRVKQLLLFKHKSQKLTIDTGDLQNKQEKLITYLQTHYNINTIPNKHGLTIDIHDTSLIELKKAVTKFIYHQNLNHTHWVSLESDCVKINKFKTAKKENTTKKQKRNQQHESITQSWGLG